MTTNPVGREVESADVLINGHESNIEQMEELAAAIADFHRRERRFGGLCTAPQLVAAE